jgi:hypothetical protein
MLRVWCAIRGYDVIWFCFSHFSEAANKFSASFLCRVEIEERKKKKAAEEEARKAANLSQLQTDIAESKGERVVLDGQKRAVLEREEVDEDDEGYESEEEDMEEEGGYGGRMGTM